MKSKKNNYIPFIGEPWDGPEGEEFVNQISTFLSKNSYLIYKGVKAKIDIIILKIMILKVTKHVLG